jgi:hypothetical protein
VQQAPFKEKMAGMVSVKRSNPTFVSFEYVGPKYLRNQLPAVISLTSENEVGGWSAKVFADGRHEIPELVQGLAMLYFDALIHGFRSVIGYM